MKNGTMSSERQMYLIEKAKNECLARINREPPPTFPSGLWCNRTWDNIMCWNDSPTSTIVKQRCPSYIHGFNKNNFAYKECMNDGIWYRNVNTNKTWTDYTSCIDKSATEIQDDSQFQNNINRILTIINFGYGASFITLSTAIIVLIFCRRFNYKSSIIHINLFLAFCVRALFALIRQNLFTHGYAMSIDMEEKDGHFFFKPGIHWECRLLFTLFVYGIAVSQSWIFVEGLYLQMLFYRTLTAQQKSVKIYVIFGWCFPLSFLIPWVIVRLKYENILCWNTNQKIGYLWIIRAPIILLIVINFLFFIDNICILFKRTQLRTKNRTARKLAKFIMMLVPLFGVPNVLFMLIPPDRNTNVDLPYLYVSVFYSSFQGVILSFLYCFLHEEVRLTIKQNCKRFWVRRRINVNLRGSSNRSVMSQKAGSLVASPRLQSILVTEINDSDQSAETPFEMPEHNSIPCSNPTRDTPLKMFHSNEKNTNSKAPVSTLSQKNLNQFRLYNHNNQKPVVFSKKEKKNSRSTLI